jgi:hypothetical protein
VRGAAVTTTGLDSGLAAAFGAGFAAGGAASFREVAGKTAKAAPPRTANRRSVFIGWFY